ncbi:unnamed protein product, partial [Larinioides sclopetarius]
MEFDPRIKVNFSAILVKSPVIVMIFHLQKTFLLNTCNG